MNCRFHKKGYPNECYIPDTEKIADKRRANFCDEFEFCTAKTGPNEIVLSQDGLNGLWGEAPAKPAGEDGNSGIKEWLSSSDKAPRDFDDLFDD